MKGLSNNEYQCARCGEVYEKGWTDEEADAEATKIFGKHPDQWKDEKAVICDDCFKEVVPADHPEELKYAKENI